MDRDDAANDDSILSQKREKPDCAVELNGTDMELRIVMVTRITDDERDSHKNSCILGSAYSTRMTVNRSKNQCCPLEWSVCVMFLKIHQK